jgi:hypothetical protein
MNIRPVQLFDPGSSTFTYMLFAPGSDEAVLIDPVDAHCERDLLHLQRLGLKLVYVLETSACAEQVSYRFPYLFRKHGNALVAGTLSEVDGASA